jgi:protein TonB
MRSSTHAIPVIPDKLVDDLSDAQDEDLTNESNGSDTTSIAESVTGGNDAGTSSGSVEGVEGDVYGSADVAPQFPGGVIAMQEYIKTNMRYPKDHSVRSASGSIMIYVIITKEGFVRDVKVIKGIQPELDAEAVRVVRAMPQWKPALRGNHPVNVKCIIPIKVSPL